MGLQTNREVMTVEQSSATEPAPVPVEMWADLGCPWCYLGRHRLQQAIEDRPDADRFRLTIRSFELNPDFPKEPEPIAVAFARAHGVAPSTFLEAEQRVQAIAHGEGLEFDLDRKNANTFDLHRVLQLAEQSGKGLAFFSELQDRFFSGEIDPYDTDTVVGIAESLGLDGDRVREVLDGDEFADEVRADVTEGAALGAQGVPFTVFGRRIAAAGAQSVDVYGRGLDQVLEVLASEQRPA